MAGLLALTGRVDARLGCIGLGRFEVLGSNGAHRSGALWVETPVPGEVGKDLDIGARSLSGVGCFSRSSPIWRWGGGGRHRRRRAPWKTQYPRPDAASRGTRDA
jgi:hypothetical protein